MGVTVRAERISLDQLTDAIVAATPELDLTGERVALAVYRALAEGNPVGVDEIAAAADVPGDDVTELLDRWPGVFRDAEGRVVGFWGLTLVELEPTHRLEVDGRALYAWCAWDTLFLPGILDQTARVTSRCPTTSDAIELVVEPDGVVETSHPDAEVSFLLPRNAFDADVIQGFCHFVHFFANRGAGERWVAEHPGTFLLSLGEAFELGDRINRHRYPNELGGGR
jgi:alkylmercury lyase